MTTGLFSQDEIETRKIFEKYRKTNPWNQDFQIVAMVFRALSHSSLPLERIKQIGEALAAVSGWDPQEICTKLTRAKVLRSRVLGGVRHYEVNYTL